MAEVRVRLPDKIKKEMERFPKISWPGFLRKAIEGKIEELTRREEMLKSLEKEQEIIDWSVKLQRASRKGRFAALKEKGLI